MNPHPLPKTLLRDRLPAHEITLKLDVAPRDGVRFLERFTAEINGVAVDLAFIEATENGARYRVEDAANYDWQAEGTK